MGRKKVKLTWQSVAEEQEIDFEDIYYRRLGGEAWLSINVELPYGTLVKLTKAWAVDNGHDPDKLDRKNLVYGIINDPKCVDSGRAKALRKAGWNLYDIAVDCHCTEECVREVLNVT